MPTVLETVGLEKHFGGIAAVAGVSLKVEKGARHALIGPNGAGKTTVINLLTGVLRPSAGRILLEGQDITALEACKRVQRGLARTFQINQLFLDLTPLETIGLAIAERLGAGAHWWRLIGTNPQVVEEIVEILARFHLTDVMYERTGNLPYGKQRLLEIVLLIEHDMDIVFSFADRISVLVNGALFVDGAPEEVARDPRVKAVYLGESLDA